MCNLRFTIYEFKGRFIVNRSVYCVWTRRSQLHGNNVLGEINSPGSRNGIVQNFAAIRLSFGELIREKDLGISGTNR
jgi:hypothetical protein